MAKKYRVQLVNIYTGAVLDIEDEVFSSYAAAEEYADECNNALAAGEDAMEESGRGVISSADTEYVVVED